MNSKENIMLNIKDVNEKLRRCPEPREITEIREKIKSKFSNLEFIPEGHKYFLHKESGTKEMHSVSSVCHRFEPSVDWESILENKAKKEGIGKEELRRRWRENNITSTSNGSLTHLFAEAYMYFMMGDIDSMPSIIREMQYEDGFLIPYGNKQIAVAKYYEDMFKFDNLFPIIPEAQIYIDADDNPYGIKTDISGTVDALFGFVPKHGDIKLSIRDWKTNKSLESDFNQNKGNMLLSPFGSFVDEPKSIYTIQLSLYQLGVMQVYDIIADRKLLWLRDDAEYQKIDVPDVSKTLTQVL